MVDDYRTTLRSSSVILRKSAISHIGLLGVPAHICAVGLYFRGRRHRFARHQAPKTAPQRRPKGSLSLTQNPHIRIVLFHLITDEEDSILPDKDHTLRRR